MNQPTPDEDPIRKLQELKKEAIGVVEGLLWNMYMLGVDKSKGKPCPGIHNLIEEAFDVLGAIEGEGLARPGNVGEATRMMVLFSCEAFDFGFANARDVDEHGISSEELLHPDFRRLQQKASQHINGLR